MNETIIFRQHSKALNTLKNTTIFKGEKNADYFEFLIPSTYNNINIKNCDITLNYTTPDNNEHTLLINDFIQSDLYKDYLVYVINIDENFTSVVGEIKMFLTISGVFNSKDFILKSSVLTISLKEHPSGNNGYTETELNIIDEVLLRSKQAIELAQSVKDDADSGKFNGKISPEQEQEIKEEIINSMDEYTQSKINDIDSLTLAKMNDIDLLTAAKISDINTLSRNQVVTINNAATTSITDANNSISQSAQSQIKGIETIVTSKLTDINNIANAQINNINHTAQSQSKAIDIQSQKVFKELGIATYSLNTTTETETDQIDIVDYKILQLRNIKVDSTSTAVGENLHLRVICIKDDKTIVNNIVQTDASIDITDYDYIILKVVYRGGSGYSCNLEYTLSKYKDWDSEFVELNNELSKKSNKIIAGDNISLTDNEDGTITISSEGGSNRTEIDDNTSSTTTVYSSSKTEEVIKEYVDKVCNQNTLYAQVIGEVIE